MRYFLYGLILTGDFALTGRIFGYSLKAFLVMLCCFVVSEWIQCLVHELGHMTGGLVGGYEFVYLSCWPIRISVDDEQNLKLQRTSCKEILCSMAPRLEKDAGCFLYVAGGCASNLLLSMVAGAGCWISDGIVYVLCLQLAITGAYKLAANGIPHVVRGIPTDGYLLRLLRDTPLFRRDFNCYLRLYADRFMHREIQLEDYCYERCPVSEKDCLLYYEAIQKLLAESCSESEQQMI